MREITVFKSEAVMKITPKILSVLVALFLCVFKGFAQPQLLVTDGEKQVPLKLGALQVSVNITGSLATTTMEMSFFNAQNRVLEGELNFPLGEGQTVSRLAMEVGGRLREGVVVEKERGRVAFEDVVRTKIDPALLEMTAGNNFKMRVYPIPARGTKTVLIAYEQDLRYDADGAAYRLPLAFKEKIDSFSLRLEAFQQEFLPLVRGDFKSDVTFKSFKKNFLAEFTEENFIADEALEIVVPVNASRPKILIEEVGGERYFYVNFKPGEPENTPFKKLPRSITLVWDASASGAFKNVEREFKLLENYFARVANCRVDVVLLRNDVEAARRFDVSEGNWATLREFLKSVKYDGATQLGALDFAAFKTDEIVLSSDGIANFGKREIALSQTPVMVVNSSQSANFPYLQFIAQASGGRFVNLTALSDEQAAEAMAGTAFQFISASFKNAEIAETYPRVATPVAGNFSFAGKLLKGDAEVTLNFGFGAEVMESRTILLKADDFGVETGGLIRRIWAQKKLAHLMIQEEKNKPQITQLGKDFSIVTRNTSLIVLERIEDYVRHGIVPPEEDLRVEYFARVKNLWQDFKNKDSAHLEYVVGLFKKRGEWWDDYKLVKSKELSAQMRRDSLNQIQRQLQLDSLKRSYQLEKERLSNIKPHELFTQLPQSQYSILVGTVGDMNGQPIPGASIRIEGTTRGAYSKANGTFTVANIKAGRYNVRITGVGYKDFTKYVVLDSGKHAALNVQLQNDTTSSKEVMVMAERRVDKTRVGTSLINVPRENVQSVVPISPGVISEESSDALMPAPARASGNFEVRGSRVSGTIIQVDGLDVGDQFKGDNSTSEGKIRLQAWNPQAPYLDSLKTVSNAELYNAYLLLKEQYGGSVGFYLDVADYFAVKAEKALALRILSNIAEMELQNHELLRVLARRLEQLGHHALAVAVFEEVLKIRGEEPQSYRDLALALAAAGESQRAVDTLYAMALRPWNSRFPEIELIALGEMNAIIAKAKSPLDLSRIDKRLLKNMPVDVRVVLNWDTDNCDMDLWVTDPAGEKCFYSHPNTKSGGHLSRDLTGGYGPEEFLLKTATDGKYKVQVNYYGTRSQKVSGPTTIQMQLFTRFGTAAEQKQEVTVRLSEESRVVDIGELEFLRNTESVLRENKR
ncbi:MAG TPA: VIT domain-containing protein [Patescibacteria group bacterium]|nr:VIT domain-containing protein [Patescibacteria group bacterium]